MPFSTLNEPADLARAYAATEAVWAEVKISIPGADQENVRR